MSRHLSQKSIIASFLILAAVAMVGTLRMEAWSGPPPDASTEAPAAEEAPLIQLALCLDTSGSMDGLIESAKLKLWAIVNELARAEPTPRLEVALLTYGNDGHLNENGWVQVDSPLTTDLDEIYAQLFVLTTNGGSEYVARVLHRAETLLWDASPTVLKVAVVAGNESADQDPQFLNSDVCRELKAGGIIVNPIYCGGAEDGEALSWRNVASLAGGTFANIDQENGLVVVETPFDNKLALASNQLNATYIPVGARGAEGLEKQRVQDANAASVGKAAQAARGCAKATKLYNCSWDLIDSVQSGKIDLEKVDLKDLPEDMQEMSKEQKVAYVEEKQSARKSIQKEIAELGQKRSQFIRQEIARQGMDESLSFDAALRRMIRRQAEAKGFAFPEEGIDESDHAALPPESQPLDSQSVGPLFQQAKLGLNGPPATMVVQIDPVGEQEVASHLESLVQRASSVRSGQRKDIRRTHRGDVVPDLVVTLGMKDSWDVLMRLLGSPAPLSSSSAMEVWVQVGTRSYLIGQGC